MTEPRNGVPSAALAQHAVLPELPGIRAWGDEAPADVRHEVRTRFPGLPRLSGNHRKDKNDRPVVNVLALSGGGPDGAFGAGLLTGWTEQGTRPNFDMVTGVSAGAIIAPFAFLGPKYDPQLKEVWTQYSTSQLITTQLLPGLLGGPSIADTQPLADLIARYVDRRFLREVAAEYRKGRLLLVGTTNLDAQRPVVWNMGEIAASNHPASLDLFRRVIMASAAIPGAFPPVTLQVSVEGKTYDEMHVDGGTTREVFVTPFDAPFTAFDKLYDRPPVRRLYIVNNGKITPEHEEIKAQTIPIAARAISTLIKSQNQSELYAIWRKARDAGADFNFIAVPATFAVRPKEVFDPVYQAALFEEGRKLGGSAAPWLKAPPRNGTAHKTGSPPT
ncbi:MAG: patatin-like phospholipase family protein [Hyphomicrobiaceae bacterium]